jgi:GNAT superfamily N-acetyltransferase
MPSPPSVELIDELAAEAWPAPVVEEVDGWRLRWGGGVTGRANSVWPRRAGGAIPLGERIEAAEAFYRSRGGPPLFQLSPASRPTGLGEELAARGYSVSKPTSVEIASTRDVVERTAGGRQPVRIDTRPDESWFETWLGVRGFGDAKAALAIVCGTEAETAYAQIDGSAVGRAALSRGWAGIFAMSTLPHERRRGAGRAILHALARWALERGAVSMYLQVEEANSAARALYAGAAFRQRYLYHYRKLPA